MEIADGPRGGWAAGTWCLPAGRSPQCASLLQGQPKEKQIPASQRPGEAKSKLQGKERTQGPQIALAAF